MIRSPLAAHALDERRRVDVLVAPGLIVDVDPVPSEHEQRRTLVANEPMTVLGIDTYAFRSRGRDVVDRPLTDLTQTTPAIGPDDHAVRPGLARREAHLEAAMGPT